MPLRKNTPMSTYIKDFKKSDAPQFKGKSKEKRREMAIAAKLQAMDKKMEEGNNVEEAKGTLCGRCGHVHVKGTPCPRPFKEGAKPDFLDEDKDGNTEEPMKKAVKDSKLKQEIITKAVEKLKEVGTYGGRNAVEKLKKDPNYGTLSSQGKLDVEKKLKAGETVTIGEAVDFFEDTMDDDRFVDVSGPSVQMAIEEIIGEFEERLKDIPEESRKAALAAIKGLWYREIQDWQPDLITPHRPTVTESKKHLKENREYDYEGKMAKAQLVSIIKNAKSLYDSIDEKTQLKSWVQSKLTKAEDYIDGVRTYLDGESVSSTAPLVHSGEVIHDDEGAMLNIGDVVKGADGRIYQAAYSYSDSKPFLTPFDLKNRKPTNLRERYYFDTVNEGEMSPTRRMIKVMNYNATKGGFVR
jgi:hypothetical protein